MVAEHAAGGGTVTSIFAMARGTQIHICYKVFTLGQPGILSHTPSPVVELNKNSFLFIGILFK